MPEISRETRITLPMGILFMLLAGAGSSFATYKLMDQQVAINTATIDRFGGRLAIVEAENRDQKIYIEQLQRDATSTTATLNAVQQDVRRRLEELRAMVIGMKTTLDAIREASMAPLPGERRRR